MQIGLLKDFENGLVSHRRTAHWLETTCEDRRKMIKQRLFMSIHEHQLTTTKNLK